MNKSGTKKFLENAKKILNSRGARLTYVVIIIIVILLSVIYGIMSITGQFKSKCPKDQSPQGPNQSCFNDECQKKTDDSCQDEIIGSKLQWDTANRPDCPDCGCDDGYSIVKNLNGKEDTQTCVEMCGNTKFPDGKNSNDYVCAYVNRPKNGDDDDNEYLKYIPVGQVCTEKVTFNGKPLSCASDSICKMDEKDKGYCIPKQRPQPGKSCPTGQNSFCPQGSQIGEVCGDKKGKCEPLEIENVKNLATYCSGTNVSIDGQMCCDPKLMTLTDKIGTQGCCNTGQTPVDVNIPENENTNGCCPKSQNISNKGICCEPGQIGTDDGECCDSDRIVNGAQGNTFCCISTSLQPGADINLQPIINSAGDTICSHIGKGTPFNVKNPDCNSAKETFENYDTLFSNNYISMNDNNSQFSNNYISMNDNNSQFNNNYSPFNNNNENVYDNYGFLKENFGSPFPLTSGDCQFKNPPNDPNINLVCEDDKCRLACGKYEPGTINDYKLNHLENSKYDYDYCTKVDCQIDESKLIFTPARSDNNVICTDGKGNNYWNHPEPQDISFTLSAEMGDKCTEQDCFNIFNSLKGLTVDYSNIGSENGQCKLSSTCDLLDNFGKEKVSIANIYNSNGTIEQYNLDCITNRGSCTYLNSGTFCKAGSLDGINCLKEDGTQNSIQACPLATNVTTKGFPFSIQCEQPSINNQSRRFYCTTKDGVQVNNGFGNGCCSFGNIVVTKDPDVVTKDNVGCRIGYFGSQTWAPIYKPWNDDNWNEGKKLRVLLTGVHTSDYDGKPSRNLIILKNTKTGNYLNIDSSGKLCETDSKSVLNLYYINNSETGTKFGNNEVRFASLQGINPHSFLAGRSNKDNKVQGVVSNNTQDISKKGDIGFLTVDNGNSKSGRDYPVRLIINQNDDTKCVLAAFHISDNNGSPPRYLQNGLNDAQTSSNDFVRLGRLDTGNYIRFNVYWSTGDAKTTISQDFSYPNRNLGKGGDPFWDLSASAEYEIVAALKETDDEFMVNQFKGKLPSGATISDSLTIGKIIEGNYKIGDIMYLLQNNIQPSAK
jgi:hypothetical protein